MMHTAVGMSVCALSAGVLVRGVQLPSPALERAFWSDDGTRHWLRRWDTLFGAVLITLQLFWQSKFGRGMQCSPAEGGSDCERSWLELAAFHVWQVPVATMGLLQLIMILVAPRSYSRHRLPWIGFGRGLRVVLFLAHGLVLSGGNSRSWRLIMADVQAVAATSSPVRAACSLLLSWSGTALGFIHNLNGLMPLRWALCFQLATTFVVMLLTSGAIADELRTPAVWPGYQLLCDVLGHMWDDLTTLYIAGMPSGAGWCADNPRTIVVVFQVLPGCVMPLALVAYLERSLKLQFMQRLRAAGQWPYEARGGGRPGGGGGDGAPEQRQALPPHPPLPNAYGLGDLLMVLAASLVVLVLVLAIVLLESLAGTQAATAT